MVAALVAWSVMGAAATGSDSDATGEVIEQTAPAPVDAAPIQTGGPDLGSAALKMLVALGIILAAIYGLRAAMVRLGGRLPGLDPRLQSIQVVSIKYLAPKRSLALVEVDGRRILVGVGVTEVRTLAVLDGAEASAAFHPESRTESFDA